MCIRPIPPARDVVRLLSLVLVLTAVAAWTPEARSQARPDAKPAKQTAKPEEEPLPPEEVVDLLTQDGVMLKATFLPGTKGKDSVPVIVLHGHEGSRKDFAVLAAFLQRQGHAVLVPDLRGHGDSTRVRGTTRLLDAKSLTVRDFNAMATYDVEACKKFLVTKNDVGELNIDKLSLVGSEMGSVIALEWARIDWSWPPLATGKQGQDVKAIVLVSPAWSFRALGVKPMLDLPQIHGRIATMLVYGDEDKQVARDARRIYNILKRAHPTADAKEQVDRTLWNLPLATSRQGANLIGERTLQVPQWIAAFLKVRVADQKVPWAKRSPRP